MKGTFYGHFVAGENEREIQPVIRRMQSFGVKSILDYSAEEDISEEQAQEAEMRCEIIYSLYYIIYIFIFTSLYYITRERKYSYNIYSLYYIISFFFSIFY